MDNAKPLNPTPSTALPLTASKVIAWTLLAALASIICKVLVAGAVG